MKKLDLMILKVLLVILTIALISSFMSDLKMMLKLISMFFSAIYLFFLMIHIVMLFPIIMIWITIEEKTENLKIKEKSIILEWLLNLTIFLFICAVIYGLTPIVLAMMYNGTIDINEALNRIKYL